jgi:hypothetical protein
VKAPPTRTAWRIDGEMRGGHTPAETLAWASWVGDYEDERQDRWRSLPPGFVLADCEPRLITRLRRLFGR